LFLLSWNRFPCLGFVGCDSVAKRNHVGTTRGQSKDYNEDNRAEKEKELGFFSKNLDYIASVILKSTFLWIPSQMKHPCY
jgi:hypothetical protein